MLFFDQFHPQLACLYCVDHICYCADIVVGDAWQKRYANDTIGTNLIICRTEKGQEILAKMKSIELEMGHPNEIIEAQGPAYALGTIGEGMKKLKLRGKYFIPERKRTDNLSDVQVYKFTFKDLVKIKIIKNMLFSENFDLARCLYIVLNYRIVIRHFLKNILNRN